MFSDSQDTVFHKRWRDVIHRVATGSRRTRMLLTPVGAAIFAIFTGAFVVAGILVDRALGFDGLLPTGTARLVSAPLVLLGLSVITWSGVHFLKARGTPVPFNPPRNLVATGPYQYVRNPMLTGVFLLLFGLGFALDSVSMVLFFTPLYILFHVWELRIIEEPELVERLGADYLEYRRRTPMFVPRLVTGDE